MKMMSGGLCLLVLAISTVGIEAGFRGVKDKAEDDSTVVSTFSETTSARLTASTEGVGSRKLGGFLNGYTAADEPYITGRYYKPAVVGGGGDDDDDDDDDDGYGKKGGKKGGDDYTGWNGYDDGVGSGKGGNHYDEDDDAGYSIQWEHVDYDDDGYGHGYGHGYGYGWYGGDDDDDDDHQPSLTPKPTISPVDPSRCTIVVEPSAQSGFPECNVCGTGMVMRNPDAQLGEIPFGNFNVSVSCGCADLAGQLGFIPACGFVRAIVARAGVCNCGP
jgi:hypothetical protein